MSRRTILIVSLLLNLLLLAGLARPRKPAVPAGTETADGDSRLTNLVHQATPAIVPPPVTNTVVAAFHWRELESTDYLVYAARLRATGCPDHVVRRVLMADIEDNFRRQSRDDPRRNRPHWLTAAQRKEWDRTRKAADDAREEAKRSLYTQLFGQPDYLRELEGWEASGIAHVLLGFLPEAKIPDVMHQFGAFGESAQKFRRDREDLLFAADRTELERRYHELQTRMASLMTASEREELELRLAIIEEAFGDSKTVGVDLTAAEARALAGVRRQHFDLVRDEIMGLEHASGRSEKERKASYEAAVREFLGEERFADFQRAQHGHFRGAYEFTQEAGLPKSVAIEIFDVRIAADKQAETVRNNKQLSPEQRQQTLAAIGAEAERTLRPVLGNSYQKFREDYAGWLKSFQPPPPKK